MAHDDEWGDYRHEFLDFEVHSWNVRLAQTHNERSKSAQITVLQHALRRFNGMSNCFLLLQGVSDHARYTDVHTADLFGGLNCHTFKLKGHDRNLVWLLPRDCTVLGGPLQARHSFELSSDSSVASTEGDSDAKLLPAGVLHVLWRGYELHLVNMIFVHLRDKDMQQSLNCHTALFIALALQYYEGFVVFAGCPRIPRSPEHAREIEWDIREHLKQPGVPAITFGTPLDEATHRNRRCQSLIAAYHPAVQWREYDIEDSAQGHFYLISRGILLITPLTRLRAQLRDP